jgi:hypothetical protein
MREQLTQYVELLFVGTSGTDEIRQEILQNSLDRFDDLVAQGKTPEAAYRLTISGIGDINEILGQPVTPAPKPTTSAPAASQPEQPEVTEKNRKLLRAIAIGLYILSAIPTVLTDGTTIGACLTVLLVDIATAIIVYAGKAAPEQPVTEEVSESFPPRKNPGRKISALIIWIVGLCAYFSISFITGGWYITWVVFLMTACVQGISTAIFDLKEAFHK